MIRGIGLSMLRLCWLALGRAVSDLIQQGPGRQLREVIGIGAKRPDRIVAGWVHQNAIRRTHRAQQAL